MFHWGNIPKRDRVPKASRKKRIGIVWTDERVTDALWWKMGGARCQNLWSVSEISGMRSEPGNRTRVGTENTYLLQCNQSISQTATLAGGSVYNRGAPATNLLVYFVVLRHVSIPRSGNESMSMTLTNRLSLRLGGSSLVL